jgi:arylsulfatase A-like enzyme
MTGLRPSTTGVYGNLTWFRDIPKYRQWVTIPQYFRKQGYMAGIGVKIYRPAKGKFSVPIAWDHQYSTRMGTPFPPVRKRYQHGMREKFTNPILQRLSDWGPITQPAEETNDWKTSALAADFLQREHTQPFFLACGIYHPHLPWYVPEKFFDQHPLDSVELPPHLDNDLDNVPPIGRRMTEQSLGVIRDSGQLRSAVRARLASIAFADTCVGHVLQPLENSRYRDNTIVVLWGDHGYDVAEKKFAKSALWQITSRTPLIIQTPDGHQGRCSRTVSLVDLYPILWPSAACPPIQS